MCLNRVLLSVRVENIRCDIQQIINNHSEIKNYAYILHDKDDTAPHYHIYLDFGNGEIDIFQIAKWFSIAGCYVRTNCNVSNIISYFLNYKLGKSKYLREEIKANFNLPLILT
ncbi:MAG: hypothetical protein LUI60_02115 [Clostridia bacterium]|nr:hypothetical protein [Clostridia bacterium]